MTFLFLRGRHPLWIFALLCCFGLVSCSLPLTPDELAKRGVKPNEGLVVGSFRMVAFDEEGKRTETTSNKVSVLASGKKGGTVVISPRIIADGAQEVFAIPVPAGDYEITGWSVSTVSYPYSTGVKNRLPMKVPFRVNAGETVYIGRMNAVEFSGKNLFGLPMLGGGMVLATDHFEKDAAWIAKDYRTIHRQSIRRSDVPRMYHAEMKRIADTPDSFWRNLFPNLNL